MTATMTVKFEIESADDEAMYGLEALLLSDADWRAGVERLLAEILIFMLVTRPGGEWGARARITALDDERGANVWRFLIGPASLD